MERVDALVIGAGVVGLAIGRALAQRGLETIVLERADAIGTQTSARNSEVIHAGIYYPTGSLKARLCLPGREALYAFCESHGVAHRRCGKIIVASGDEQVAKLSRIEAQAVSNGVHDLRRLDGVEARRLEPALRADAALLSPSTGIVDSHGLMLALQGDLEAAGGAVALRSPLKGLQCGHASHVAQVGGDAAMEIEAHIVVNAAGLWAPLVASGFSGLDARHVPTPRYAKGHYFSLASRAPFSRLVYPVPPEGGLGVHLTLDLAGQARFGPDVEWISPSTPADIDYRVDERRMASFEEDIRAYWPSLPDGALAPAYSGVRPKLSGPGEPAADFLIQGPQQHGIAGLVNCFGIESPGLTSCLAIAEEVLRHWDAA